jgi:hypothetical protein
MGVSSSCFESSFERLSGTKDSPEYIDASAGESDDGLMVPFSLASFAVVESAAVVVAERAESGLVEDALEALVAAAAAVDEVRLDPVLAARVCYPRRDFHRVGAAKLDRRDAPCVSDPAEI